MDSIEALEALSGGADIIDIKDPSKGSLGAPQFDVVKAITRSLPPKVDISVALGDNPKELEVLDLALKIRELNVAYVKVGSFNVKKLDDLVKCYRPMRSNCSYAKCVAVAYADYKASNCLSPIDVLNAACASDFDVFMIDTLIKNGKSTFDHLDISYLLKIRDMASENGVMFALAGSLKMHHVDKIARVRPDVVGFRGAACNGDRVKGRVSKSLVQELVYAIRRLGSL